jgi:hypothetical protein
VALHEIGKEADHNPLAACVRQPVEREFSVLNRRSFQEVIEPIDGIRLHLAVKLVAALWSVAVLQQYPQTAGL